MIHKAQGWKIAKQRGKRKNRIPPFAPSRNEVLFYKKYIDKVVQSKNLPKKALILGATPELRDGAIEAGLESYAADISQEMMGKFSSLMKYKHNSRDKMVIRDWLKMKFSPDYFGIVMGDGSFNNLATRKDNEILTGICKNIIKKGGYLVLRQLIMSDNHKSFKNAEKTIRYYRHKKLSWEDFFMGLRFILFRNKAYNKSSYQHDSGKAHALIDKLFKEGALNQSEYDKINQFRNNVINTLYPDKKFIKMLKDGGFKLISTFHDKPHRFFSYLYLMVFRKIK